MRTLPFVESARQAVLTHFAEQGQPGVSGEALRESILIRNGYYAGRRFSWGGLSAVWWAESGEIAFAGGESTPIRVLDGEPIRRAA